MALPSPYQPIVWIDDLPDRAKAALREHAARCAGIRERMRDHETHQARSEGVRRERPGRLGRVSLVLVLRRHTIGDFDDGIRIGRPLKPHLPTTAAVE